MGRQLPQVTLVRHGETEWSRDGKHTGRTDIPLTPVGELAARGLPARLAGFDFVQAFSSPRARALQTARLAGFEPTVVEELAEWNYGDYEGLTTREIRERRPDWDLFKHGCPNGETSADMAVRVDRAVARLMDCQGDVVVFAHGHLLRVLAARWLGQPVEFAQHLLLGTAAICRLSFDHNHPDEPAIALWNATASGS